MQLRLFLLDLSWKPLLDLDYAEDSIIDADYNFVFTQSEKIIEIQGAAEKNALIMARV